ncbi:diflavin oxidoreductase, partial [Sphingobium sp. ba1]|uniref:diflavin oxidoreductase n=1 Tax=Sphingobium sp. ba1 TaxID=1522072 RepID=UPI001873347D
MLSEATLGSRDSRDSALKGSEFESGSAGAGASPAVTKSVLILFATETGASEDVAKALGRAVEQQGLASRVLDMADADVAELSSVDVALFVASTTGDGDAPYAAESYFAAICADHAAPLDHLSYAVLALGDATYEHFCAAGRRLDDALAQRGARRLLERVDCDIDYEEPAAAWRTAVLGSISQEPLILPTDDAPRGPAAARGEKYRLTEATVVENRVLTGEGSTKATRHIALAFSDTFTAYEPGDALGVFVQNDPEVVAAVLAAGGLAQDVLVTLKGEQISLSEALNLYLDITSVTPRFLEAWAELAQSQALLEMAQASDAAVRANTMRQYHIVDIMREYPAYALGAQTLVDMLRSLQPRLYSIASSLKAAPGEVHLTIAPVSYPLWGEVRRGVATGQLCERTAIGTRLQVYVQGNSHFRLPAPDTPIIMIGAGTGVAP